MARFKLFRVLIPVLLDIEIEAEDAQAALRMVERSFKLADPLNSANVRVPVTTSLEPIPRARAIDAVPQGAAYLSNLK